MNKEHLHNHIIINAYLPDGVSKFGMDSARRLQIRELSDTIQRSYGIEITLADPKTQLFKSKGRGTYREWDSIRKNISWKLEILRRVGNRYQPKKLLTTLPTTKKIEMMEQALSTIEKLGLERRSDLEEKLDSTGAKLNHIKSQLKRMEGKRQFYDLVEPLLKDLQDTKRIIDSIEYWPKGAMPDLMLSSFSPEKVQKTRAQCCPMSGSQKRDLYLALQKHPEYTLSGDGFTGVSAMDAGEILNFFRGDCTKPEILKTSTDAAMEKAGRVKYEHIKIMCGQRTDMTVSLVVGNDDNEKYVVMSEEGTNWYEAGAYTEVIVDGADMLKFRVDSVSENIRKVYGIALDEFPDRPPRTTRLGISVKYNSPQECVIRVVDKGFGEFFKSSGKVIEEVISKEWR